MLLIPIATNNLELLKTVAAVMTGVVGTILGYYFGSKKNNSPIRYSCLDVKFSTI
jgi:hypothetical protein